MWDEIDVVPTRVSDRVPTHRALLELGLLVAVACVAVLLQLLG